MKPLNDRARLAAGEPASYLTILSAGNGTDDENALPGRKLPTLAANIATDGTRNDHGIKITMVRIYLCSIRGFKF